MGCVQTRKCGEVLQGCLDCPTKVKDNKERKVPPTRSATLSRKKLYVTHHSCWQIPSRPGYCVEGLGLPIRRGRENPDSGVRHSKLHDQHLPLLKSFDVCVSIVP